MADWIGRARRTVGIALLGALMITVVSVWLGAQALSGGIRIVWFVLAAVFAWISLARLVRLWWDLGALARHRAELIAEIAGSRTDESDPALAVIEMVERTERGGGQTMFVVGQGFADRRLGGDGSSTPWLRLLGATARRGLATAVASTLITAVFAVMALLFLVALAL